jgi:hypothetical protein
MATVLLSIFAHGLTALPGISLYARKIMTLPTGAPEQESAETNLTGWTTISSTQTQH